MAQLNVPMPTDLQRWIDSRVVAEGYADAADYVRQLVQRDHDDFEEDVRRVQALIDEGDASGIVDAEPEDVLREIIAEMREARG
jgi:Arc/MetJ-type ribon-helix-helix transcriptional regulator